jgi:hypothetical protein
MMRGVGNDFSFQDLEANTNEAPDSDCQPLSEGIGSNEMRGRPIRLDIGGTIFKTSLETLTKDRGSMLATMFSGRFSLEPQKDGTFFIDRDPTHFRLILNFLRTGRVIIPTDQTAREELLLEAEFFNIKQMIDELSGRCCISPALNPTQSEFMGSSLLREEDKANLLSWLDIPCAWHLIYKASRDGFRAADFHRCCDNKGETVCVIHSTDGYLFGGYTDIPWTSSGYWKTSTKSFLFALRSFSQGNRALKASIVNSSNAVYHDSFHCCTFGGGPNIYIAESSNTSNDSCSNWYNGLHYHFPPGVCDNYWLVGQRTFQTLDIEIFGH